jgi:hypothetical protein
MHFKSESAFHEVMHMLMTDTRTYSHYGNQIIRGLINTPKGTPIPVRILTGGYGQYFAVHVADPVMTLLSSDIQTEFVADGPQYHDDNLPDLSDLVKELIVKSVVHDFVPIELMSSDYRIATENSHAVQKLQFILDRLVDA